MIREILIYICTFICLLSAGVVYWGMESNLKILSEIKKVLGEWAEVGTDECPSCKGNDKNSRLVMDATLGMDYECSDDWHISKGGAEAQKTVDDMVGMESDMNKIQGLGRRG